MPIYSDLQWDGFRNRGCIGDQCRSIVNDFHNCGGNLSPDLVAQDGTIYTGWSNGPEMGDQV